MLRATRRKLLGHFGLFTSALLTESIPPAAAQNGWPGQAALPIQNKPSPLRGIVHGLGSNGRLFPGKEDSREDDVAVITSLDLVNGSIRQTALELPNGHAAMGMGDGRILCVSQHRKKSMILDPDHNVVAEFISPATHLFGGHGLVLPSKGVFIVAMRAAVQKKLTDYGIFQIYDLKTMRLLDQVESGGLHPHEIHVIPDTDELAATHYGDIHLPRRPFDANVVETKLTIVDSNTFKPKRHYVQQDFNAMVTHMRVDKDRWAYFVLTQYIKWPKSDELRNGEDPFTVAAIELDKAIGHRRTFPLPYQSQEDRSFPIPLPFVRVNTQTGERQIINTGDKNHLRSQSVAYSEFTNMAIALYYHSDNLIIHRPGQDPEIISGSDLLLTDIRGVSEIPGTPLIAVMGTYRGTSVFDLEARKVVSHYPTLNYEDTHLYHDAVVGV
jgi:hypothetical protein